MNIFNIHSGNDNNDNDDTYYHPYDYHGND